MHPLKTLALASLLLLPVASIQAHSLSVSNGSSGRLQDTIPATDSAVYIVVEKEAEFPGGEEGWRRFLEQTLNGNIPVTKGAPAGIYTVYVQFVVSKDGKLSDFKALTKHGFGMESEVIRALRKSPEWIPAVQNQRTVGAYRKQPVTFQVIDERKKKKNRG